jgi:hypothetical protein
MELTTVLHFDWLKISSANSAQLTSGKPEKW